MLKFLRSTALATACAVMPAAAFAVPAVEFIIDGDTFTQPFFFTNTSTAGEGIVGFTIDLTGSGLFFDTINGGAPNSTNGVPFTPVGGSGALTGLTSSSVVDGGQTLSLAFGGFDVGETFTFDIDVDEVSSPTVLGNEMIGVTAIVDFTDGQSVLGIFAAVDGNSDASAFGVTGIVPTPAVPLPASALLVLSGLGLMGAVRARKSA